MKTNGNRHDTATRDYERVEAAIQYLDLHVKQQPELDELAEAAGLSSYHFHRLFSRWVGTTPKRFLQFLTAEYAKKRLHETSNVLEAAWDTGLSGGGRLHDLMVNVEAVTPGELKKRGEDLVIRYGVHSSPFGDCLLAVTDRGICALEFLAGRTPEEAVAEFALRWPEADIQKRPAETAVLLDNLFPEPGIGPVGPFTLLIKGTNFQLQVWRALLEIPPGALVSYGAIARHLGKAGGARAVGQAVGSNPISYLIPCHRVIASAAGLGGYRWGLPRKQALLAWEAVLADSNSRLVGA